MSIRRRMMQNAIQRWRHLGLGLTAAKERLALTVHSVIQQNVSPMLSLPDFQLMTMLCRRVQLRCPSLITPPADATRVVLRLIPPQREEDPGEAPSQGDCGYVTPAPTRDAVRPGP